ncbi:FkbM family methyltransferase [Candidatus Pantoea floridensis]|uniref:Methyltransferase, FkbM family n=1 Tax=Candidatus Pantoea floridensis TaxID=1938870 RepID=A0A286BXH5_9GAMM|nr:FkbM family methyltransferase [Pantoea floridensis]PIF21347.1 FkbM family methyltransferase [Enterobacteriaceae bacterium JKS000233]SOD38859.1 methyltransferase, FkbM family [Pantoea floridensis]
MISYAQNYEDVMLWRALKHIENGFYIDVGAAWPEHDSVTKHFYDSGWTGINIEPNPSFAELYLKERKRDINLQIAISDFDGFSEINFINDTGLSTLKDDIAKKHTELGFESFSERVVVKKLAEVMQRYVHKGQEIHFLKIDVEGLEKNVLLGMNWEGVRPWIIVVESTVPLSQEENFVDWEYMLSNNDYACVYYDGLNRFYLAKEHNELKHHFRFPPNVFDNFIQNKEIIKDGKIKSLENEVNSFKDTVANLDKKLLELNVIHTTLQNELDATKINFNKLRMEMKKFETSFAWKINVKLKKFFLRRK